MTRAAVALLLSLPVGAEIRPTRLTAHTEGPHVSASLLIENTNDNTANLEITLEALYGTRVVARSETSTAVPPLVTTGIEAELTVPDSEVLLWDLDTPYLYTLRAHILKQAEAVEGSYQREIATRFAFRTVELSDRALLLNGSPVRGVAAADVSLDPEHLSLLREAGIEVMVDAHPAVTVQRWADENGLLIIPQAPPGLETVRRFVPDLASADGHGTDAYQKFREAHAPAILRTVTEVNGVTQIEVKARQRLHGYSVRVGNQEQSLPHLEPGEVATLAFPSVNPYRVEVRSPRGFVVADR